MKLTLSQKQEFDTAMVLEISQVIISKALRDLNKNELARLERSESSSGHFGLPSNEYHRDWNVFGYNE